MGDFYRLCRAWHGYLSAAAFVWLLFFSITGVLLNHPTWSGAPRIPLTEREVHLQPAQLAAIKAAKEQGPALVQALRDDKVALNGDISRSDIMAGQAFIRLRGVRGSSDVQFDLQSGRGSVYIETFPLATMFKELHRGEQAGPVWRLLIDVSGILLTITSIIGLLIYFSLRMKLRNALILIGAGLTVMAGGILLFVR